MYLKSLEINGFKSFANRTRLVFRPGMMAIVGPNGCGKSNICDAIRWVMGETSAKALRGTKMEDVIFNGTDSRKPLGMAEVSMTFADCEDVLETEYNEMTISRRAFRSGENQYFINKTRCRRKDIHKLFLDTGMGTMSYSMLQQGHIDMILSSRPEDRRGIFEEASGINKYKADKNEAIRKLEQTEANLVRLEDVIREVKRQIGSLQRQAGKARRYKTFRDELRGYELFVTREDLHKADALIKELEASRGKAQAELDAVRAEIRDTDVAHGELQRKVAATEEEIGRAIEAAADARSALERSQDLIRTNAQRIDEYEGLQERDSRDLSRARGALEEQKELEQQLSAQLAEQEGLRGEAERDLEQRSLRLAEHEKEMGRLREERQRLHNALVELESRASSLRNERMQLESREGANVIRRERLATEQAQLTRVAEDYTARLADMETKLEEQRRSMEHQRETLEAQRAAANELQQSGETLRHRVQELRSLVAAGRARHEILADEQSLTEELPGGARAALDEQNPLGVADGVVRGLLAAHLEADESHATALEAVLRAQMDALVVRDLEAARDLLVRVAQGACGPIRVIAAGAGRHHDTDAPVPGADRLLDRTTVSDEARGLAERLLGDVWVVDTIGELPIDAPVRATMASRDGAVLRSDGTLELWTGGDTSANPISRRHAAARVLSQIEADTAALEQADQELGATLKEHEEARAAIKVLRDARDEAQVALAMHEGEHKLHRRELTQTQERLETVRFEAAQIEEEARKHDVRKDELSAKLDALDTDIAAHKHSAEQIASQLHTMEDARSSLYADVTEHKVQFTEVRQRVEHMLQQRVTVRRRHEELEEQIRGQTSGIDGYQATISELRRCTEAAEARLDELQHNVETRSTALDALRRQRSEQGEELGRMEELLSVRRAKADELREHLSSIEVRQTETTMRRQNRIERITGEYHITEDDVRAAEEPEWGDAGRPPRDELDTLIAELRTKLEAMGPVNLVAIEEHHELEERYAFLTHQYDDLVNAKTQLKEMITRINETSSALFTETFHKINENFQGIFSRFFGGGTAKLVLVNEEDVLDCGIEIIARPPGKRLQNVSLLSGGERTLTAVALLFSIYLIKPSPFCVLDELDAALDDTNIGRFVDIVQDFVSQSQFLIVTHNERTIAAADVLYGVTMVRNTGISNIVSMRYRDRDEADGDAADGDEASADTPETATAT